MQWIRDSGHGFFRNAAQRSSKVPKVRVRIDTVKVGINYRWGGPIVARY
jgi:hypothetical protein